MPVGIYCRQLSSVFGCGGCCFQLSFKVWSMGDTLQHYWQQIMAVVAAVIWGARLEGRASQNSKDLANLERRLSDQRREDMEVRARDWGRMEAAIDEMRKDIKELLGRKS